MSEPIALRSLALSVLLSLGAVPACSSEDSTTGKRITLHTEISSDPVVQSPFTTGFGWQVTLSRAKVATSAFYYFDGPPPTAFYEVPKRSLGQRLAGLFEGTAWAHPGHYQAGTALGQALFPSPVVFDLFSPDPVPLADGAGVTGTYRSARFVLPMQAPADPVLDGHLAAV